MLLLATGILTPGEALAGLSNEQANAFTPGQLAAMTSAQIDALPRGPAMSMMSFTAFDAGDSGTAPVDDGSTAVEEPQAADDPQSEIAAIISSYLEI